MSQATPRIAPLTPPYPPEIQAQFDRIMRGAPPLLLFQVMAGHTRAWDKFRAGGLLDPGPLSLRQREIVIDRTCALNKCEYEWGVHVAIFAAAGGAHRGGGARDRAGRCGVVVLVPGRAGADRRRRGAASPRDA